MNFFKIIILIIFLSLLSCLECINENTAIATSTTKIVYTSVRMAQMRFKQKVFISYEVDSLNYNKSFVSSGLKYYVGQTIIITTSKNPNLFCLQD